MTLLKCFAISLVHRILTSLNKCPLQWNHLSNFIHWEYLCHILSCFFRHSSKFHRGVILRFSYDSLPILIIIWYIYSQAFVGLILYLSWNMGSMHQWRTQDFIMERVQQGSKGRAVRPEEPKVGLSFGEGQRAPFHQLRQRFSCILSALNGVSPAF